MGNGLFVDMGNLHELSDVETRSLSAENPNGEKGKGGMADIEPGKGAARELGRGWKVRPCVHMKPGETVTFADIAGPGAIQQMWFVPNGPLRNCIFRVYWDDQKHPSIECPVGDFFCAGWGGYAQLSSLAVCLNPGSGMNCYWPMPFRKRCRMTMENRNTEHHVSFFYQVNYALGPVADDAA
ncbi:MAG TPA: DUF2961 domain-containing protein, partial [Roseimicrobium sp.]|nr:DUF2961 domain-containing protein [Roseimicrobium sp.]